MHVSACSLPSSHARHDLHWAERHQYREQLCGAVRQHEGGRLLTPPDLCTWNERRVTTSRQLANCHGLVMYTRGAAVASEHMLSAKMRLWKGPASIKT